MEGRSDDERFMRRALELAKRGLYTASPNPMVGAVIVKGGRMIAEGWHERVGRPHAEAVALEAAGEEAKGATLYVNLEPCCFHGHTPPCTKAIIEAGIRRVVVATRDPNPLVNGKGIEELRAAGIEVVEGVLREEAERLNEQFLTYMRKRRPFFSLKFAMTLDGKIASRTGASRWITSEEARRLAHDLRAQHDAVMVGVGTVLADDPLLTPHMLDFRPERPRLRVVVDTNLRTPPSARLLSGGGPPVLIAAGEGADEGRAEALRRAGAEVALLPRDERGRVDLRALAELLRERKVLGVLCEGGGTLAWSLLRAGLVDKVYAFVAPKVLGGEAAKTPVEGEGFESPDSSLRLRVEEVRRVGPDVLIVAYPER